VIDNRVLRKMYGAQREEVTGSWRKLCNEKFSNTCLPPDIIRLIKCERMEWTSHVAT
jgi:hypothetical protein